MQPNESMEINANDSCPNGNQMQPNTRSALSLDRAVEYELKHGRRLDPKMDRKRLRRIVSNRLSAHRARARKVKYVNELEKMVNHLEDMKSVLTSKIESYKENRKLLLLQNESLQRLLVIRMGEAHLSEIQLIKNRMEVCKLKELEQTLTVDVCDPNHGELQMQDLISQENMAPNYGYEQPKMSQSEADIDQYLNLQD